jgi:hypothetical protein
MKCPNFDASEFKIDVNYIPNLFETYSFKAVINLLLVVEVTTTVLALKIPDSTAIILVRE